MFRSIRWRLSILYFLLVFIAMSIVGVVVSDRLEDYNLSLVKDNLNVISKRIENEFIEEDKELSQSDIKKTLERFTLPVGYNVYVVDAASYEVLSSTNESFLGENAMDVLDANALMTVLNEKESNVDVHDQYNSSSMTKIYAKIASVKDKDYIIYSTASLDSVYALLRVSTRIILSSSAIALVIALLVGYIISGSITNPINELNTKASLIARGDFTQRVNARSNDEIGMLGKTFNYLTKRLDSTLVEISSEKSKLDAIINNMADGIMVVDSEGFVVMYNKSLLKLLETKGIVFYGNNLTLLSKDIGINLTLTEIRRSMVDQDVGSFIIKTKNDKTLRVSSAYFKDDMQKQTGYILLFQDFTKAQKLEDMRKEFVANVSHELKTPITTIKTYAETLLSGAVDDRNLEESFLTTIEKEADRMALLIKDLLQLSSIDFKKINWDFKITSVNEIIIESMEHLKIYYEEKNQKIDFISDGESYINADRAKLKQVFVNIISNAIKYTNNDGNISVETFEQNGKVIVKISDDGIGIPKEDIDRVFDRFYRVDKARSREQGGTGLGLAIAKDIIVHHSGEISVESVQGLGTTFIIKLPLAVSDF